ncbi:hypothetical protein UlMin_025264 [Ulmus minor]
MEETHQFSAHHYTIIKVARDEDLLEQIGKNIYFELVDHDKVRRFRILKLIPFNLFKEEIAKEFGVPVQFQRFWLWKHRGNLTYRPHRPLTPLEEAESVGQLIREDSTMEYNADLNLFLEVELGLILLFFKIYDPVKEELRYVGRLFVKGTGKPVEILAKLKEMAGFSADEQIELFEEMTFDPCTDMCQRVDNNISFRCSQTENRFNIVMCFFFSSLSLRLVDGDIICFQKSPQAGSSEQCRYPDVRDAFVYWDISLVFFQCLFRCAHVDNFLLCVTVVAAADSSSFAKFDAMFAGIQNLLEEKTSEAESSDSFLPPLLSIEEISNAKGTFKRCLDQTLTNVIISGWTQEFINSFSVMLTANAIPNNLVEELSWFLSNFDQSCERYMAAKQDIVEAEGKENSVGDLKTNLKQLYHLFMPIRNEAASVDEEIAELERQLTERKVKKARLQCSLEDLTRQAATSRETVINAELDMKLNKLRKEQAEKTVVDMERSWESLKAGSSPFLL